MIDYNEALEELKALEERQSTVKQLIRSGRLSGDGIHESVCQSVVEHRKKRINTLLSIIVHIKQARKFYGALKDLQGMVGMTSPERAIIDKVLNETK